MKITKISAYISDTQHRLEVEEFTGTVIKDDEGDYIQLRHQTKGLQQVGVKADELGVLKGSTSSLGVGAWGTIYIWTNNPLGPTYDIEQLKKDCVMAASEKLSKQIERAMNAFIKMRELQKEVL